MDLNLNKLPWHGQMALFVVLGLALIGGFYWFYAVPAQAEMVTRKQKFAALRITIAKGSATANQLNQFREQVAELEGRLESLKAVLPEQKDVADLLRRIQTLATQSNLAIRGFKPAPSVTKQLHAEWPIALQLDGTYHNLATFFDRVSKFPRIINVSNIMIRGKDKPEPTSTISVECVATTFVLLETAKLAAPAASPQPAVPATANPSPAAEVHTYDPAARRDPFVSLLSRGMEPAAGKKLTKLAGLTTSQAMLRGVIQSRNSYVALLSGPDGKTFSARVNDRLLDGVIRSVTLQGIVIVQEVNDPLSLVKQREVRKGLRTAEDGK
jgi:type IV pilus assembly protein PilO